MDYGVPQRGHIRFFTVPPGSSGPWYISEIAAVDRSLNEWLALINKWNNSPISKEYDAPLGLNPFTTRRAAAAFLTELLAREMRLRWIARKFVAALRERVYARRCIGADCDLFTTAPIPAHSCVYVRDRESRTHYAFHVRTATYMIISAINYSHYGIAAPQAPKNPYTNKPWSQAQLMVITSQICAHTFTSMRHNLHPVILEFRKNNHDVATYFSKNSDMLMLRGAVSFFKDIHNPDLQMIIEDLLDDLYETIGEDILAGSNVVRSQVIGNLLPVELGARWTKLLCAFWIYTNFQKCVDFTSHDTMLDEFSNLHEESYNWWNAQPKTILRRLTIDDGDDGTGDDGTDDDSTGDDSTAGFQN